MSYMIFGLTFCVSMVIYAAAVVRTKYDCKVDDEEQEEFIKRYRG